MNVMNIKHLFLAAATLGVFAACSDYDPGMSEKVIDYTDEELATIQEYTANFVERYGEIDPNHTWGFGDLGQTLDTRQSDPNSNLWITITKGPIQETDEGGPLYYYDWDGQRIITHATTHTSSGAEQPTYPLYKYNGDDRLLNFTVEDGKTIPGFPVHNYYLSNYYDPNDVNAGAGKISYPYDTKYEGWYHCRFASDNSENPQTWFPNKNALIAYAQEHRLYEIIPLGDVAVCNDLDDPEVADVYAEFSEEWTGTNPDINLDTYFVQQVWKGTATYTDIENHGTIIGGNQMDYLAAYGENYTATDDEHFYNFNYGDYSNGNNGMMRIYDSNTENFSYHNSYKSATIWNRYRLVYLHGNWYVGFDFALEDGTYANHVYNDWIVKIVPGDGSSIDIPDEYTTETSTRNVTENRTNIASGRVMCEDLGTTNDFDFNDVVFDVTYTRAETRTATYTKTILKKKISEGNYKVISETEVLTSATDWTPTTPNGTWTGQITLLASGGTLPIYVQNFPNGQQFECHETLLGANASNLKVGEKYNPINVGANVNNISPVTLPPVSGLTSTNPDNINIYVHAPSSSDRATQTIVLPSAQGGQYENVSEAPQKICVPVGTKWMRESQQIEWTHTYFRNWVNKENDEYNFGRSMDWTTQGLVKTNLLY